MPWAPASNGHAIDRVRILLELASPLSQKVMTKLSSGMEARREGLGLDPRAEVLTDQVAIVPTPQGPTVQSQRLVGWTFSRPEGNAAPKEAITVNTGGMVYESTHYTRWSEFIARFTSVGGEMWREITAVADVRSISLEYYDRFIFHGEVRDANARALLSDSISSSLTASVLDCAELFHLHRGWFHLSQGFRFLANHNIDAQDEQTPHGDTVRVVNMLSKVDLRDPENSQVDELDQTLTAMHALANEIFRSSLSGDMLSNVGMAE